MRCFSIGDEPMKRDDIDIRYIEYGCDEPEHSHDAIEIAYVVSGRGEHIINNKSLRAERGFLVVIDYSCVHSFRIWENMKYYNLLLKSSFLSKTLDKQAGLANLFKEHYDFETADGFLYTKFSDSATAQKVEDLFFEILSEGIQKKSRHIGMIKSHVDEIINLLLRNLSEQRTSEPDAVIAEAMQYIGDNCNSLLRLEEVAGKFNYNPKYFSNKLKEYCGLSFKQLLLSKRLSNVIDNLWKTEDTIDDIIEKCGFTNKTYFYEIFEKMYGVKPKFVREYRKNYSRYLELKAKHEYMLN